MGEPEQSSADPPMTPAAIGSVLLVAAGCIFFGMAVWILILDPRPNPAPWDGWRLRDVLLTLVAAHCLRGMAGHVWGVVLGDLEKRGWAPVPALTRNLGSSAWQTLACVVAVGAFALAPYGLDVSALGLTPVSNLWLAAGAAIGFAAGPGALIAIAVLGKLLGDPIRLEGRQLEFLAPAGSGRPWAAVAGMLLVAAVLGPVAEELLFRGVVYPGLRNTLGPWAAVPLSAAVFGLAHRDLGWVAVGFTAVTGVVFALLVEGSGSVWPAVVAHVLINTKLVAGFVPWFRRPGPDPKTL